jgi:hypothetical protein
MSQEIMIERAHITFSRQYFSEISGVVNEGISQDLSDFCTLFGKFAQVQKYIFFQLTH